MHPRTESTEWPDARKPLKATKTELGGSVCNPETKKVVPLSPNKIFIARNLILPIYRTEKGQNRIESIKI